jgi:hypothetical protein
VDSVTTAVSADETTREPVLDTREIPLELLASHPGAQRMVTRIQGRMEEQWRVPVTSFNSSV